MLAFVYDYDAIVLDVVLPDASGLQIVRALRQEGRATPVLLLTGNRESEDVVRGLDAGADDYLTKPFDMDVLKARVRALLRRGGARRTDRLAFGGIVVDRLTRQAATEGRKLQLTPKEYSLLEHLIVNAERVVTRTELLEKVWDVHFDPGSNVVDVHVARLRDKLRRIGSMAQLVTIRGTGFMLTRQGEQANRVV
jgi:DNA-binding response OmpR family regulator